MLDVQSLLDACVRNMDVDNCSMVMIMSQTFFRVVPDSPTGREYIVVGDTDPGTSNGDSSPEVGMGIDKQVQPPNDDNGENAPSNTNTKAPSPNRSREEAGKSQVVGEKEFMQARLQRHPVWQDITYWEETLQRGVRAEVERNCPRSPQDKVQYMCVNRVSFLRAYWYEGIRLHQIVFTVPYNGVRELVGTSKSSPHNCVELFSTWQRCGFHSPSQ